MVMVPVFLRAMPPDAAALLAAGTDGADPTSVLVQYGVLGVLALTLGPFAYQAYKWQVARGDKAETKLDEMQTYIREQVVPALIESAGANRASAEANRVAAEAARDATALITRVLAREGGQ